MNFGVDTTCTICLKKTPPRGYRRCPNQHRYHKSCIQPWLREHPECPTCRVPMRNRHERSMYDRQGRQGRHTHQEELPPSFFIIFENQGNMYEADVVDNQVVNFLENEYPREIDIDTLLDLIYDPNTNIIVTNHQ